MRPIEFSKKNLDYVCGGAFSTTGQQSFALIPTIDLSKKIIKHNNNNNDKAGTHIVCLSLSTKTFHPGNIICQTLNAYKEAIAKFNLS